MPPWRAIGKASRSFRSSVQRFWKRLPAGSALFRIGESGWPDAQGMEAGGVEEGELKAAIGGVWHIHFACRVGTLADARRIRGEAGVEKSIHIGQSKGTTR